MNELSSVKPPPLSPEMFSVKITSTNTPLGTPETFEDYYFILTTTHFACSTIITRTIFLEGNIIDGEYSRVQVNPPTIILGEIGSESGSQYCNSTADSIKPSTSSRLGYRRVRYSGSVI
jgi:hypothetical protein